MSWHLAETSEQAEQEAMRGLHRWHNEYNVHVLGRPGAKRVEDPEELLAQTAGRGAEGAGAAVIGTPDEMVAAIRKLQDVTGGFGTVLGFAHDWANREATLRSWELFARYVIPEINGYTANQKASAAVPARQPEGADAGRVRRRHGQDRRERESRGGDGRHDAAHGGDARRLAPRRPRPHRSPRRGPGRQRRLALVVTDKRGTVGGAP